MTSNDTELFELCKSVYEATRWGIGGDNETESFYVGNEQTGYNRRFIRGVPRVSNTYPYYTSDYLLEKLPKIVPLYGPFELVPTMRNTRWSAGYWSRNRLDTLSVVSDTPLKALLRLALALNEAKEKYND